jgi:hypothetical protein
MIVPPPPRRPKKKPRYAALDAVVVGLILGTFLFWFYSGAHGNIIGGWRAIPLGSIAVYLVIRPSLHRWLDQMRNS